MGGRGFSLLSPTEETELEEKLRPIWMMTKEDGTPKFNGKQIGKALWFGGNTSIVLNILIDR